MAELIATGNTASSWVDFTVAAGSPVALYIKGGAAGDGPAPSGVKFEIAHKTATGRRIIMATLDATNIAAFGNVAGAGTWSVRRLASNASAGLDQG